MEGKTVFVRYALAVCSACERRVMELWRGEFAGRYFVACQGCNETPMQATPRAAVEAWQFRHLPLSQVASDYGVMISRETGSASEAIWYVTDPDGTRQTFQGSELEARERAFDIYCAGL